MSETAKPIIAVCGKGGVGKTVVCALLSRVILDRGLRPLLLIDADPVSGLVSAIGEKAVKTIGSVRQQLIAAARDSDDEKRKALADQVDYLVLEALLEKDDYAVLAMGRKEEKGCFCPVNSLLRSAIDVIVDPFATVLIDAEAGVEQINREVTRSVSQLVVVTDGSARSNETLKLITELVRNKPIHVIANRCADPPAAFPGVNSLGAIPEDDTLRQFDREGRSLWQLPADSPALRTVAGMAPRLGLGGGT